MELRMIRGGTKDQLQDKKYNIGVGISLGNKWFTPENIIELVRWSLVYTRENVIVYVADSIHAINEEVRGSMTPDRAMTRSLRKGNEIIESVKNIADAEFSDEDKRRIVYVTWNEIVDEEYEKKMAYLIELFHTSPVFSEKIKNIVRNSVAKEEREFSEEKIDRLSMYILHEMPEIICRVPMKEYECDAYAYPFDGELTQLAEQIQKGEIFPEIKENVMDTEPKVFLEVR